MGQKTLPISLRLNKKKNWSSKWIVNKEEYSDLFLFELYCKKYFELYFNYKKFKLIKFNFLKKSNNIYIYLYISQIPPYSQTVSFDFLIKKLNLYYEKNNIKIIVRNLKFNDLKKIKRNIKKIFRFLKKKNKIDKDKKKLIYIFNYAFFTKNIEIISFYIKKVLENKKIHKKYIKNINKFLEVYVLYLKNIKGYRLQLKGRLNGSKRKKKLIYQKGKIALNSLDENIVYSFNFFKTPLGICSIKLWVLFN